MPKPAAILFFLIALVGCRNAVAQSDSSFECLRKIDDKYISAINKKVDVYTKRVTGKTIKTLTRLSRWEQKIKNALEKINPEAANDLFGNEQNTFTGVLKMIKEGEAVQLQYNQVYDKYRDDLATSIKYIESKQTYADEITVRKIKAAKEKMQQFNRTEDSLQAIQEFIRDRKSKLINTAFQYMGNSKLLSGLNKEAWYYAETVKNYKELFTDETKVEKLAQEILNGLPGFQKFMQKNSMLASIFGAPGDVASAGNIAGLQTREELQGLMLERMAAAGPGAQEMLRQNLQSAQSQLNQLKDKLIQNPFAGNGGGTLPDFKPNTQKTKTFLQRLEFGGNMQFSKNSSLMPTVMDVALTAGYRLNDRSVIGIGSGYKLGLGSIDNIRLNTQGISLRGFADWKVKGNFYLTGGWEMNYLSKPLTENIQQTDNWQQSALAGITKKINVKTKWCKQTSVQLLYDFFARQHMPLSQQVIFRVGYGF